MTDTNVIKTIFSNAIDGRIDEVKRLTLDILHHPETGYREYRTSRLVADWFRTNGFHVQTNVAKTGVIATIETGRAGPHVAVLGELDALIVPEHIYAAHETGAAHACGHHAQIGSMITVAAGLLTESVIKTLTGKISFMATPAEEYIELGYRQTLVDNGEIEFFGGKQEFIKLGFFDSVDIAMLTHTGSEIAGTLGIGGSNNGMVGKTVRYLGKAAHAGGAPHLGINSLNAAHLALAAIHAQRETFRESDTVRVHPIITKGGSAVNSVPSDVRIETYVRASNVPAILVTSQKIDRAFRAGALATGAAVEITTNPGYLPAKYDSALTELYRLNASSLIGHDNIIQLNHGTGCTDMGDVSQIIPAIQPTANATTGSGHGVDYRVENYELAITKAGKAMGMTLIDLLTADGAKARDIAGSFDAPMTIRDYLHRMRSFRSRSTYQE
ncbi:MAG: amidohydrolase [SAR202 cluster bacterium]|nr:amidohydrolase [SAR202 cluster bacterium]|tara:strand:+ start:6807 stop:8132 length:1326 start_codon:yes stop_codon:yes gene_type:complete